jgi:hypothetical protein
VKKEIKPKKKSFVSRGITRSLSSHKHGSEQSNRKETDSKAKKHDIETTNNTRNDN